MFFESSTFRMSWIPHDAILATEPTRLRSASKQIHVRFLSRMCLIFIRFDVQYDSNGGEMEPADTGDVSNRCLLDTYSSRMYFWVVE